MNTLEKVSVIIPIYNMEKYLDRCIKSVVEQTYENIEIILINDGSSDMSEKICMNWSNKDNRIIYKYIKKSGVSAARNYGITLSVGAFILFVDADDYIESDMVEKYIDEMHDAQIDLIIGEYNVINQVRTTDKYADSKKIMRSDEAIYWILSPGGLKGACWSKMFRADIIRHNEIMFDEKVRFCEDVLFVYQYIKRINQALYIPMPYYNYCIRKDSTMSKEVRSLDDARIDIVRVRKRILDESKETEDYYKMLQNELVISTCLFIRRIMGIKEHRQLVIELKEMIHPYLFSFFSTNDIGLRAKFSIFIGYYFPYIAYRIKGKEIKRTF